MKTAALHLTKTPAVYLLLIMLSVSGVFCALAAWKMWPLVDGDGPAFFPAAVEWSLGRPLTNPVWLPPLDDSVDGPGGRRYIYHGFLYALAVGGMGRELGGGPEATVRAAYVLHWAASAVAALAVLSWAQGRGRPGLLLAGLLPPSMLALSVAWHGRIEPLGILLVAAACLAWRWLEPPWADVIAGTGTAFLFFTSPASGALAGCVLLAALLCSRESRLSRRVLAALLGLSAATVVAIWIYPYPILDWVDGVRRFGRIVMGLPVRQGFIATWLTRPDLPLLGLSLSLLVVGAVSRLVEAAQLLKAARGIAVGLLLVLFAVGLTRIALLKTEASYNAVVWMPLLTCLAVSGRRPGWRLWAVIAALSLPAVGLVRSSVILAGQFDAHAVGFQDVRARIRELAPQGCAITPGLWLAAEDLTGRVTFTERSHPQQHVFVLQETNTGQGEPPEYPGYQLLDDHFAPAISLPLLHLPLSRTAGGWEFAVYRVTADR